MKSLIQQTVEILKQKVKENLERIKENQVVIKELLAQPNSTQKKMEYDEKYQLNKNLLSENNDFINVQLTLINFLEKYGDSDIFDEVEIEIDANNPDEVLHYTISGDLVYNEHHPYFANDEFFQKLLKHYELCEDYETCNELIKKRK